MPSHRHRVGGPRIAQALALALAACMDQPTGAPQMPDAQDSCPVPTAPPDFYGDACVEAAYPANTICYHGPSRVEGICISGVCRPECHAGCRVCDYGTVRYYDRGACYCSPT